MSFGKKKTIRDSFKKATSEEFIEAGKLYFKIKDFKYSDFKSYYGIDKKVDLKIKTYYQRNLDNEYLVKIDNDIYEIIILDVDSEKMYCYLYLQKVEND